jgi:formylglycine-generating enzyme required for sulfatase activity
MFPWGNEYGVFGEILDEQDLLPAWVPGTFPSLATPEGIVDLVTRRWEWCADLIAPYARADRARWQARFGMVDDNWRVRRGGESREVVANAVVRGCAEPDGELVVDTAFRLVYPHSA